MPTPSASPVTGTLRRISSVKRWPTGAEPKAVRDLTVRSTEGLARMTFAPACTSVAIVGIDARIRESSWTYVGDRDVEIDADEDALAGDIRVADRELVHAVRPAGRSGRGHREASGDERDQVGDPATVAPLVVVPGDDLHHVAAEDHGRFGVDDR